ncbi:hypothetical protein [Halobacillus amylolyticus]|uniref:Helix-turn-helix domain-containing protein n=1 Tax=Halobacillus amylolyticus TaxID=2932259 RepID=A0ABY4H702_9BACI|nr:hypothetical protein [Halobacillus amylolyticus]UOR10656.1 hypothetical protein MUO15_13430 [Halobacillus amylolyticus]
MNNESEVEKYYSLKEASEVLNARVQQLKTLISQGRLKNYKFGHKTYLGKKEIDNISSLLKDTYSFRELLSIVRDEMNHDNFEPSTLKYYIINNFELTSNPINGKDYRFYKADKLELIQVIKNKYKVVKRGSETISDFLAENKSLINVINTIDFNGFYDFNFLREFIKTNYYNSLVTYLKALKHIFNVCPENDVLLYSTNDLDNIYIRKEDLSIIKDYYDSINNFNKEDYYTKAEVQKMFDLGNTDRIAKLSNAEKVRGMWYFDKEAINKTKKLKEETILKGDARSYYGVPQTTFSRLLKKLSIKVIPGEENPLAPADLLYVKDLSIIEQHLTRKKRLDNASSLFDKFQIEVEDVQPSFPIPETLKAYNEFLIGRFKKTRSKYVYTNQVNTYRAIIPHLEKEIMNHNTDELLKLMQSISQKVARREFSYFLDYCKTNYLTKYEETIKVSLLKNAEKRDISSYSFDQWTKFGLILFANDEELIEDAVNYRTNAMVWLYCAMHYICAWRTSDLLKIPMPSLESVLGMSAGGVIRCIKSRNFTTEMAQKVVNNVLLQVKVFDIKPQKTRKKSKQHLKLAIGESYVYKIGMLIALCEAHRVKAKDTKLSRVNDTTILTNIVTKRNNHTNFFGNRYNEIFGDGTFLNNRANKTYLNTVQNVSSSQNWGQGYDLAAIIRGHRKDAKGIAQTTQTYLESINRDSDVDKITQALLERGSFGFMSHLLLKMFTNENDTQYETLDMQNQNKQLQSLIDMKPSQIEMLVKGITEYRSRINQVYMDLIQSKKEDIKGVLQKISLGETPSKMEYSQCLFKTINRTGCIYPSRENCIGCEYAMNETYFLIEFNKRLTELFDNLRNAQYEFDKKRYTHTLFYVYLPVLQEAISFFGKDRTRSFIKVSKQEIVDLQQKMIMG